VPGKTVIGHFFFFLGLVCHFLLLVGRLCIFPAHRKHCYCANRLPLDYCSLEVAVPHGVKRFPLHHRSSACKKVDPLASPPTQPPGLLFFPTSRVFLTFLFFTGRTLFFSPSSTSTLFPGFCFQHFIGGQGPPPFVFLLTPPPNILSGSKLQLYVLFSGPIAPVLECPSAWHWVFFPTPVSRSSFRVLLSIAVAVVLCLPLRSIFPVVFFFFVLLYGFFTLWFVFYFFSPALVFEIIFWPPPPGRFNPSQGVPPVSPFFSLGRFSY